MSAGRLIGAGAGGIAAGGAAWLFGVDAIFATAWGLLVGSIVIAATAKPDVGVSAWPPVRETRESPVSSVARLAWAVNVAGDVARPHATRRVRALADVWLDERGLRLDRATDRNAVDVLLGVGATATLTGADARLSDLQRILSLITDTAEDDHDHDRRPNR